MKPVKRIKYRPDGNSPHLHRSIKKFPHPTNGAVFSIVINTQDNTFQIVDELVKMVAAEGKGSGFHKTLIAAKNALASLGIDCFVLEERPSRKKVEVV